jgi:hypothetical protein
MGAQELGEWTASMGFKRHGPVEYSRDLRLAMAALLGGLAPWREREAERLSRPLASNGESR